MGADLKGFSLSRRSKFILWLWTAVAFLLASVSFLVSVHSLFNGTVFRMQEQRQENRENVSYIRSKIRSESGWLRMESVSIDRDIRDAFSAATYRAAHEALEHKDFRPCATPILQTPFCRIGSYHGSEGPFSEGLEGSYAIHNDLYVDVHWGLISAGCMFLGTPSIMVLLINYCKQRRNRRAGFLLSQEWIRSR